MATTDKPFVFAVDLDGVCAHYTRGMAEVVAEARGLSPDDLPEPTDWVFSNWNFAKGEFSQFHYEMVVNRRGFATLPPFPGVSEALWALSDAEVYIRILTHRLGVPGHHSAIAADTVQWLETNNIPYRDLCFMSAKADLAADLYVDDAPHNIEAITEAGGNVLIFDQPYNQEVSGLRAYNWDDVRETVLRHQEIAKHDTATL